MLILFLKQQLVQYPPPPGGGGGTPLYLRHKYVPPPMVRVLHRFGPKMRIDFANCRLNSGMVFEGIRVHERIGHFNSKRIRKKEQLKEYSNHVRKIRCQGRKDFLCLIRNCRPPNVPEGIFKLNFGDT